MLSVIHADITVHFKTGATLNGDLAEFILFENTKAMKKALSDSKFMSGFVEREVSIINLEDISFIHVQHIHISVPQNKGE